MSASPANEGSDRDDPAERRERRRLGWAILLGVAIGAAHGIARYGPFHMMTVALAGLGMIVVVAIYAAVIALMPAKPLGKSGGVKG